MGNVGSSNLPARGQKAGDTHGGGSGSGSVTPGQAVTFDRKSDILTHQNSSQDDDGPYYTATATDSRRGSIDIAGISGNNTGAVIFPRPRSNTISEGQQLLRRKDSQESNVGNSSGSVDDPNEKTTLPTVFKWDGGGKQVYISGTFSNWKAMPMVKSHGDFVTIIDLPEGDHQYKFMVDGEWRHDPKLKNLENDAGTKNNLVSVRQSDFEVFQALAKDSEDAKDQAQKEYSQDIPEIKPWEKATGPPPVLPPHLLQVILNKDTPLSCEPTLLPEPNHVMLNHLYALSIKDGVMVLSATHRYNKKYVTTLLYKPI